MTNIFLKSITIKGYKGFTDSNEISLCVPNGTLGSGLNIFVGENASGKTSLLEAINLLLVNNFTGQSKISSSSFNNEENNVPNLVKPYIETCLYNGIGEYNGNGPKAQSWFIRIYSCI